MVGGSRLSHGIRLLSRCESRGGGGVDVPAGQTIRQAALEFGLDHPAVATCLMGCRTPDEIDQVGPRCTHVHHDSPMTPMTHHESPMTHP